MKARVLAVLLALAAAPLARAQYTHDPASDVGPSRWGAISFPVNATCGADFNLDGAFEEVGKKQSPIDIVATACTATVTTNCVTTAALPALTFSYVVPIPLDVENNGHTIEVISPPGNFVKIGADRYELKQFHIHTPSEHTVAKVASALELHLVHQNAFGDLAVVGILFDTAVVPANATIEQFIMNAPMVEGTNSVVGQTIDPTLFLPAKKTYWAYTGSLTTPPCSEGVRWSVFDTKVGISAAAVTHFEDIVAAFPENAKPPPTPGYRFNNRPVRPLGARGLIHSK